MTRVAFTRSRSLNEPEDAQKVSHVVRRPETNHKFFFLRRFLRPHLFAGPVPGFRTGNTGTVTLPLPVFLSCRSSQSSNLVRKPS